MDRGSACLFLRGREIIEMDRVGAVMCAWGREIIKIMDRGRCCVMRSVQGNH